ncbi:MAG: response regulator [Muribaculaceae bacterium]|nr:response regulator [Muribaculaceae bacterium]
MTCRAIYIQLCLALVLTLMAACGRPSGTTSRAHLEALDAAYARVSSVDTMLHLVDSLRRSGDEPGQMMALKQLGKLYRNNSCFQQAIDAHTAQFDIACRLKDTIEIVRALNNLGTNFRRMGVLEEATGYHYQALSYCDRYSRQDDSLMLKNRVVSLNGIGNIYMTTGNYQAADSVLRAALAGERSLGSDLGQAINLANIGSILEHQGHADSAWIYYRQSLALNERVGSQLGISLCHTHFGELYEQAGHYDRAVDEYHAAYGAMLHSSDSWHRMEACVALARVYIKMHDYTAAQYYVNITDSIATSISSLEHQAQVYKLRYQLARSQGDSPRALRYFQLADSLEDSVNAAANSTQMLNARVNYERQRRQAEFDLINRNYENERKLKNIFIFSAVLVVLLAAITIAFLLYTLRARRRGELLRQQLEQMRTSFFTNVTHEFRTPLTVIMGLSAQLQKPGFDGSEVQRQASIIHRQGSNLLQLINQLLDISRVRSAIGDPEWRHGNVVPYVAMLTEAYQALAEQQGISLRYAAQSQDIGMDFAPYYLRRIVGNLLGNAIKFTPADGHINVTCGLTDGDMVQLTVADDGRGIAPGDLPHIFEPFYLGKAVSHGDMSTGVGLSLVRQVVDAMQGNIVVHSDQGKGTVFTITLPRRHGDGNWPALDDVAGDIEAPHATAEVQLDDARLPEGDDLCRVLVVDDHNDVAYYIGQQLGQQYHVSYAANGRDALDKAEQLVPDLLITDLMMPEMDGYELCRQVRRHPVLNHIPIIMVTARCTDEDRMRGYELGADAYLEKPFNPDELRLRVATLLDQRRQLRQHFLRQLGMAATQAEDTDAQELQGAQPQPPAPSDLPVEPGQNLRAITAGEQAFMLRLVELAEQAMTEHKVDLELMASQLAMTSTQLRRKVHAITGKTPLSYINQLRLGRAAQLLRGEPDLTIGDIADRCGYDDMAYFSRQFKQFYGQTPSQYRSGLSA